MWLGLKNFWYATCTAVALYCEMYSYHNYSYKECCSISMHVNLYDVINYVGAYNYSFCTRNNTVGKVITVYSHTVTRSQFRLWPKELF